MKECLHLNLLLPTYLGLYMDTHFIHMTSPEKGFLSHRCFLCLACDVALGVCEWSSFLVFIQKRHSYEGNHRAFWCVLVMKGGRVNGELLYKSSSEMNLQSVDKECLQFQASPPTGLQKTVGRERQNSPAQVSSSLSKMLVQN